MVLLVEDELVRAFASRALKCRVSTCSGGLPPRTPWPSDRSAAVRRCFRDRRGDAGNGRPGLGADPRCRDRPDTRSSSCRAMPGCLAEGPSAHSGRVLSAKPFSLSDLTALVSAAAGIRKE